MKSHTPIRGILLAAVLFATLAGIVAWAGEVGTWNHPSAGECREMISSLAPLHTKLPPPEPGCWRDGPGKNERGQTFAQYLQCNPTLPTETRKTIYLLPIGQFTKAQQDVLDQAAEFLHLYYVLPVTVLPAIPDSAIPARARRVHPEWGEKQYLSTYILDEVLKPRLPKDGMVLFGITATDLWPGRGWNFVFGQASLRDRVGVQSMFRNGQLDRGLAERKLFLLRTIKTATHEMGHVLSMRHCIAWECNMCGSNHREESDKRPLWMCPECVAKLCWAVQCDPVQRYLSLAEYCKKAGLEEEAKFYQASASRLQPPATQPDDSE